MTTTASGTPRVARNHDVTTAGTRVRGPRRRRPVGTWLAPSLVALLAIAAWYVVSMIILGDRNYLLPPPHTVILDSFVATTAREQILTATMQTTSVALTGLAIAAFLGITWGVAMSQARWIERSTFPYAVILQCIPILAIVPLIGLWFGYAFWARVVVCVLIALFPIVSNTVFGIAGVDPALRDLFRLQGSGRWTVLTKLQLPAALPAILAGARISAGLAVVGAIVGDFFFQRGTPGLGSLISMYTSRLDSGPLFGAIFMAASAGVVVFWAFGALERIAVGRWHSSARR